LKFVLGEAYRWIWRAGLLCLAVGGFVPLAAPPKNRPTTTRSNKQQATTKKHKQPPRTSARARALGTHLSALSHQRFPFHKPQARETLLGLQASCFLFKQTQKPKAKAKGPKPHGNCRAGPSNQPEKGAEPQS
jgi:hypothetical protein